MSRFGSGGHETSCLTKRGPSGVISGVASAQASESAFHGIYDLQERVSQDGWTPSTRRYLIELLRPQLEVTRPLATGPVKDLERARPFQLMQRRLQYRDGEPSPEIPDSELAAITPLVRQLSEDVSAQEDELGPFDLNHIPPINPDPQLAGAGYERGYRLGRLVFWYVGLFQRLTVHDSIRARHEFDAWFVQENTLFYRLQIWACGLPQFLPSDVATQTLAALSDDAFWTQRGQRDLLLSLKARWNEFDAMLRDSIEKRLLKGPPPFKHTSRVNNREWQAHTILERVMWLTQEGCTFHRPVAEALAKARIAAPRWKDDFASHAATLTKAEADLWAPTPISTRSKTRRSETYWHSAYPPAVESISLLLISTL